MTPIETIATIVVVVALIKMIILLANPKAWMNFTKGFYAKPGLIQVVGFILAIIVLYYLIDEGITIVQIMAVIAFVALLTIIGLAPEVKPIMKKYEAQLKKGTLWKKYWFYAIIWLILIIWATKELFF
ncbi:MAG: hypothetical protein ABIG28_02345 [archaeon]